MKNKKLNEVLANFIVMHQKALNLHWNVRGQDFMPYHKLTEALYEGLNGFVDDIAEKVSMNGELPISTLAEALKVASIKEVEPKYFTSKEVVAYVIKDLELLLQMTRESETSQTIQPLLDEMFVFLDKQLWFFKSSK